MLLCIVLPTLVYLLAVREPPPRWRAAYFDGEWMEEAVVLREERDVEHDWSRREPPTGIRADGLSVRWDSCLDLAQAQTVTFQLISDGLSRLFVDGALVIDNRGSRGPPQAGGAEVSLDAGVRHLRVEYQQEHEPGSVTFVASLDGKRPRRIPPERLRFPSGDAQHPCGKIGPLQGEIRGVDDGP